jgi:hypothetical protein
MDALCRITLLEPYLGDPAAVVGIRDGQRSLVPMGAGNFSISDPSMHVGFNSAQTGQPDQNRFNAAQDIAYELTLGPEGSIIVPVPCAHIHFGDWTIHPGDQSQARVKRNYAQERVRVAMNWGDWGRMPRGKKTNNGVAADTRCISLPAVPHVKIEVLEQNGLPYGTSFDPWKHWKFEADIDMGAVNEAKAIARELGVFAPEQVPAFDLSNLSDAMLERLAALLEAKKGGPRGNKASQPGQ